MRYTELEADKKYNFIVPIGSLEQHGPYAPFGTDTYVTDYLVDRMEDRFPELVILPMLEFSRAEEHRGFYGTVYLREETLIQVMYDICHSLYTNAETIFITSYHANDPYINRFIQEHGDDFAPATIVLLDMMSEEDEKQVEEILGGPLDDHAGNGEISEMLHIDATTVKVPNADAPKHAIENAFETNNLADKSADGIADNHPEWVVSKEIGQKSLEIWAERMAKNIESHLR